MAPEPICFNYAPCPCVSECLRTVTICMKNLFPFGSDSGRRIESSEHPCEKIMIFCPSEPRDERSQCCATYTQKIREHITYTHSTHAIQTRCNARCRVFAVDYDLSRGPSRRDAECILTAANFMPLATCIEEFNPIENVIYANINVTRYPKRKKK